MITEEKTAMGTITIENVSRRNFLQGMLATSAFVLCSGRTSLLANTARNGAPSLATGAAGSVGASAFHPSIFVGIHSDGAVYIVAHRSEMGNGVRTSLPRILADELDADWSRVTVLQADGDVAYGFAVLQHRARAAKGHAASKFCSGQSENIAQVPQQRHFRIAIERLGVSVHLEMNHRALPGLE